MIMDKRKILHLIIMWGLVQKIETFIALMVMFGFSINI
jgi:hypothetical protein